MRGKKKVLSVIAVVCLLASVSIFPVHAGQNSSGQNSTTDSDVEQDGMEISSGSQSGTQFYNSYSLTKSNGAKVNFWINNTGSVAVKITINEKHEKTVAPGENGYISASVGKHNKTYKFHAVPTPDGGDISIDYRIAQRGSEPLLDNNVSGGPDYVTVDLATDAGHDINVYFKNEGSGATTVTLQKKGFWGKWSDMTISGKKGTAFSVPAGCEAFRTYDGSSKAACRVALFTPDGSDIYGHLRVKQK